MRTHWEDLIFRALSIYIFIPPPQNVWGGGLYWIRFVASVGRSVSNSCPLYNSFTNGRISFKLEWHIHLNKGMCRAHVAHVSGQGQGHS